MATRAHSILTEPAAKKADYLVARTGSFKVVVSAGVLALARLPGEEREALIAEAQGFKLSEGESAEALFQKRITQIVRDVLREESRRKRKMRHHVRAGKQQQASDRRA